MKRVGILLMVMLVSVAFLFTGCGSGDEAKQNQQQDVQQNVEEQSPQDEANPAGVDVQDTETETVTLHGEFQGLADGHSAEIVVDNEPIVFQFYDEAITEQLEIMETGTTIQFDAEMDTETGVMTIMKLYEITE